MANLTETTEFPEGIFQLETTTPALGGPPDLGAGLGLMNVQAQQLANRTRALQAALQGGALLTTIKGVDGVGSGLDADLLDGKHASAFLEVGAFGASTRLFASNGYQIFPSGLIIQWGRGMGSGSGVTNILFPLTFPTACRRVVLTDVASPDDGAPQVHIVSTVDYTTSGFNYRTTTLAGAISGASTIDWFALGN